MSAPPASNEGLCSGYGWVDRGCQPWGDDDGFEDDALMSRAWGMEGEGAAVDMGSSPEGGVKSSTRVSAARVALP